MLNSMSILPVGAELFHADGQTDKMKLTVDLRNLRLPLHIYYALLNYYYQPLHIYKIYKIYTLKH